MIFHVVTFRFNADVGPTELADLAEILDDLPARIPALQSFRHGPDLGLTPGTGDYAVIATFDDEVALQNFLDHPAHAVAADKFSEMASEGLLAQINVPQA